MCHEAVIRILKSKENVEAIQTRWSRNALGCCYLRYLNYSVCWTELVLRWRQSPVILLILSVCCRYSQSIPPVKQQCLNSAVDLWSVQSKLVIYFMKPLINKSICLSSLLKCWCQVGVRSQAGVVNAALQGHHCIPARGKMCQDINLGLPQILYCVATVPMVDHFVSACKRGVEYNILLLLVNHVCRWIEIDYFWNEE